ncbi:membrane protein [Halanaerocella petrolearia]
MDIKKCKRCKKVFSPVGGAKICPRCKQKEEEDFEDVKEYLWDYPDANLEQITEDTGVDREIIRKFIREGRLLSLDGVNLKVECQRCGTEIDSGKYCEECSGELQQGLKSNKNKQKEKKKNKSNHRMFSRD